MLPAPQQASAPPAPEYPRRGPMKVVRPRPPSMHFLAKNVVTAFAGDTERAELRRDGDRISGPRDQFHLGGRELKILRVAFELCLLLPDFRFGVAFRLIRRRYAVFRRKPIAHLVDPALGNFWRRFAAWRKPAQQMRAVIGDGLGAGLD